jgi:hypothetical protein
VKRENGALVLTDDGYVIEDLKLCGCELHTPKRLALLRMTVNGFGVELHGDRLEVTAFPDTFPLRKHSLVQAMLAVNDLFYVAEPHVQSLFYEDVLAWLELHEVRYSPGVHFAGKSGYDHKFDFLIPKSRSQPERLVSTVNRPNSDAAKSAILRWEDTREVRPPGSRAYVFLNDSQAPAPGSVTSALRNYDIRPVPWSEREHVRDELAA